MLTTIL